MLKLGWPSCTNASTADKDLGVSFGHCWNKSKFWAALAKSFWAKFWELKSNILTIRLNSNTSNKFEWACWINDKA